MQGLIKKTLAALAFAMLAGAAFSQAALPPVDGEVRKVDLKTGTLTLRHGQIKNLNMGPMTMSFRARDKTLITELKPGDKIRFTTTQVDGVFMIESLEPVAAR